MGRPFFELPKVEAAGENSEAAWNLLSDCLKEPLGESPSFSFSSFGVIRSLFLPIESFNEARTGLFQAR